MVKGATLMGLSRRVVDQNLVDKDRALEILEAAHKNQRSFLREALESSEIDRAQLLHSASEESGMPLMDLGAFDLTQRPIDLVDARFIEAHGVLPLFKRGTKVFLAVPDPTDIGGLDAFKFQSGLGVEAILVDPKALTRAIRDVSSGMGTELADLENDSGLDDLADQNTTSTQKDEAGADTPIVRFVNKILMDAIRQKASDIHIEPYEGKLRVRYRLDGIANPPLSLSPRITARIKILSNLDIAERRAPQDGRMKLKLSKNHEIDFRVSTLPTQFGEKVVIRVLDSSGSDLSLQALGLEPDQFKLYEEAIHKPYGMILVTGPTGSGKTVSLYSALS
ncbi:MAG: type IV-A pilus assembly ATPase PilB, partial [Gammaproteobacteria bacterium]|nr:type IV-A pilus assembly ATPase PilB [Gammaproteobacteria bacterium]